ncbi:MAG: hypothetical protein ACK5Q5_00105 [Planctomycetaceae bacterium]
MSVSAVPTNSLVGNPGWIRSKEFDLGLIFGAAAIALVSGGLALVKPELFGVILILDLWLLGYHHVISTFTRLCCDRKSFQEHRFLVVELPLIVIAATIGAVALFGTWVLPTTYLYWQWFHYTRQSYGVERMFRRKAPAGSVINDYITTRSLYLLPLFGIVYRSWQAPETFLGMNVRYLPVSDIGLWIVGGLAAVSVLAWLGMSLRACFRGELAVAHFLYVLSHQLIFTVSYLLIDNITTGWLVLNVWHNIQYIMFVWWFNNKRFNDRVDEEAVFLSTISQRKHIIAYLTVCVFASTLVYAVLQAASNAFVYSDAISVALITTMVLNFHHYVVDGIIWKRRKAAAPVASQG